MLFKGLRNRCSPIAHAWVGWLHLPGHRACCVCGLNQTEVAPRAQGSK